QTCRPYEQPLNKTCAYDFQCGKNAVCRSRKCECAFGSTPSKFNNINCDQARCNTNADCAQFSNHSECNIWENKCRCKTSSGWSFDRTTQTCVPESKFLNQSCIFDSECGSGAMCGDNKCRCEMGYLPDRNGGINCNTFTCLSDYDCAVNFDPH